MSDAIKYSWDKLHSDTLSLCNRVRETGFDPDLIVGIVRGGAVPAVIASHNFTVPVSFLNWSTRDLKVKSLQQINELSAAALAGKRILVIEDIVDSGETMYQIKSHLFDNKSNVMYTSLWFNPSQNKVNIHMWANIIDRSIDKRWIIFPFEV